jgi:predicted ATPase/DNA-binding SARP family transcriptional activator
MDRLRFGLLGPMTVTAGTAEIPVHGTIRRRLLARLLIARGEPVAMDRLREDIWDAEPPASAASTLKSHVSLLRRVLGPGRLVSRGGGYALRVEPGELDLTAFEVDAFAGREMLRSGDAARAAETLGRALGLWRGRALVEVAETSWGQPEAVRMEELRAAAIDCWLEARLALGETHQVVAPAEAAVAEQPLREQLWAKLITALYRSGRQAEALRAYQRLRQLLGDELGIDPSPELVALEASILRHEPTLAPSPSLPARPSQQSGNLPGELTSFVPRPNELEDLAGWLRRPCLLTLVGPGGTGKTRLAVEAARRCAAGLDATWLCELAAVADPGDIVRELGLVVGCADQAGVDLVDLVARRLSEGRQLLILDNCEHLLEACAELASRLRAGAPQLTVVVTSRAPLEAVGEVVYRVPPMSTPLGPEEPDRLIRFEAVRLFVERAAFQQPHFSLDYSTGRSVAAICRRLDGTPLAIELAAARLRTMSVVDIEQRLDDRFKLLSGGARTAPTRQRTLRGLIDWSYELLDEPERSLFMRLAVFSTSFDHDAAETVAGPVADSAADLLASLVDKSLIQFDLAGGRSRYRMLETIREYALGRISPEDELHARRAHARHFLDLALRAMPHLVSADHLAWRSRLECDDENLRAAFVTMLGEGRPDEVLQFAPALCRYWLSRGSFGDEMALIESALDLPGAVAHTRARGEALAAAAFMYFRRGDNARSQARLDEALVIARELDLPALAADALRTSAWVADRRGDREAAAARADEAVEMALASGTTHLIARAYDVRAATGQESDPGRAKADYTQSLYHSRLANDVAAQASTLNNLAILELEQGDHRAARGYFNEASEIAGGMADPALLPFIHYGFGLTSLLDGDYDVARAALVECLGEARRTGQRSLEAYALLATAVGRVHSTPDRTAAELLGAGQAMFERLGERPEPTEAALCAEALALLAGALGDDLETALASGRLLDPAGISTLIAEPCPTGAAVVE